MQANPNSTFRMIKIKLCPLLGSRPNVIWETEMNAFNDIDRE